MSDMGYSYVNLNKHFPFHLSCCKTQVDQLALNTHSSLPLYTILSAALSYRINSNCCLHSIYLLTDRHTKLLHTNSLRRNTEDLLVLYELINSLFYICVNMPCLS